MYIRVFTNIHKVKILCVFQILNLTYKLLIFCQIILTDCENCEQKHKNRKNIAGLVMSGNAAHMYKSRCNNVDMYITFTLAAFH